MELKDIGTKELKELNLYPIKCFYQLKTCLEYGYCEVYVGKGNRHSISERRILPEYMHGRINLNIPNTEHWVFDRKFEIKDFDSMKTEELSYIITGASSLSKIIWLRKYLNGEVKGKYSKIEDSTFQDIITSKEIIKQDETITNLKSKVFELQEENRFLKEQIKQKEKEIKKLTKLKLKISNFILETKSFLESDCVNDILNGKIEQ